MGHFKFTDSGALKIANYFTSLLRVLDIMDYRVVVKKFITNEVDYTAQIVMHDNYKKASLWLSEKFIQQDSQGFTETFLHEACHVLFHELDTHASGHELHAYLPLGVREIYKYHGHRYIERACDHVSQIMLPLVIQRLGFIELTEGEDFVEGVVDFTTNIDHPIFNQTLQANTNSRDEQTTEEDGGQVD